MQNFFIFTTVVGGENKKRFTFTIFWGEKRKLFFRPHLSLVHEEDKTSKKVHF